MSQAKMKVMEKAFQSVHRLPRWKAVSGGSALAITTMSCFFSIFSFSATDGSNFVSSLVN